MRPGACGCVAAVGRDGRGIAGGGGGTMRGDGVSVNDKVTVSPVTERADTLKDDMTHDKYYRVQSNNL